MIRHLAILGASGHGKVIADAAALDPAWQKISFFDDSWPDSISELPWPILGNTNSLLETLDEFSGVVIGIGDNALRQQKHHLLVKHAAPIVSIIHPKACISPFVDLGLGSVVFAHAVLNIHASTGLSCIVNTGATIDHDCQLGDFVHISPGAHLGGAVVVGDRGWVGIGSSVKQCISIGSDVVIGAGSAVVKSLENNQVVAGIPAMPLHNS